MGALARALLVSLGLMAGASHALGQDTARADALFEEGKAKLAAQQYAQACPLLAQSFELDPATGTLLALALCHERAGELESAIAEYRSAAQRSRDEDRADREQAATARADALEHQLAQRPKVPAPTASREPEPEPEPEPSVVAPTPHRSSMRVSTGQWIGIGTAGAGVVALGVSAGFAARAASLDHDSDAGCEGDLCTARARQTRLDARSAGDVATLMVMSGAVLITTGAAIFFSAGPERTDSYAVAPWLSPHAAGAMARGQF